MATPAMLSLSNTAQRSIAIRKQTDVLLAELTARKVQWEKATEQTRAKWLQVDPVLKLAYDLYQELKTYGLDQ